jgi:V/A-type H+-transporting ATPase subunit C
MDDYRYTYAVARITVLSTKLLDRSFAARMLAAEPNDILRMLGETAYSESLAGVQHPAEVDRGLISELAKTYELLDHIAPEKEIIELFRRRYDYYNLKALLKSKVSGIPTNGSLMDLGTYSLTKLTSNVTENAYRFVPDYIRETALSALAEYNKTQRLESISYICDRSMWSHLLTEARRLGNRLVIDLVREYVDLANVKTFIRIKEFTDDHDSFDRYYIPGGTYPFTFFTKYKDEQLSLFLSHMERTGDERRILAEGFRMWPEDKSFWRLEAAGDNFILNWFHQMRMKHFSIAPLLYYLLRKESDAKLIRTVIKCKMVGMPRKEIEERVRFLYV